MTKNILVLDRMGYSLLRGSDGRPFLPSSENNVFIIASKSVENESNGNEYCEKYVVDFDDRNTIFKISDFIHKRHPLYRVVAIDEEDQIIAAQIRENLALQGFSVSEIVKFRNKGMMKEILGSSGIPVPKFEVLKTWNDAFSFIKNRKKCVLKPIFGMGSSDTYIVESCGEIKKLVERKSLRAECFEIEEFVSGVMYHVDSITRKGRTVLTSVSRYLEPTLSYKDGKPLIAVMLDRTTPLYKRICDFQEKILQALVARDIVTHLELFVTPDDKLVFCEIAARPGGGGVSQAIFPVFGVNLFEAFIALELGTPFSEHAKAIKGTLSGYIVFPPMDGNVVNLSRENEFNDDWIVYKKITTSIGSHLNNMSCCLGKTATFVVVGESENMLIERLSNIKNRFRIRTESSCCKC